MTCAALASLGNALPNNQRGLIVRTSTPCLLPGRISEQAGRAGLARPPSMRRHAFALWLAACLLQMATSLVHASAWQSATSLHSPRAGAAVLVIGATLHIIGGVDGTRFLFDSEHTSVSADGGLSTWALGPRLNEARGFFGVAAHRDHVYAVGGGNGPNGHNLLRSVERAPILDDGRLGAWKTETHPLQLPRRCAEVVVVGEYLYALGGFGGALLDSVERAPILDDGRLGEWELVPATLTLPRYISAITRTQDTVFVLGGHQQSGGAGINAVEWARDDGAGGLSTWQRGPELPDGRYGLAAVTHDGQLFSLGGLSGAHYAKAVYALDLHADATQWRAVTALPLPLANFGAVMHGDYLYVLGGTNEDGYYDSVYYTRITDQGEFAMPAGPSGITAAPAAPAAAVQLPHEGTVLSALPAGTYTYLEVASGDGREWLAAASAVAVGARIRYSEGIMMRDFHSKTLGRRFALVRFVGKLEVIASAP